MVKDKVNDIVKLKFDREPVFEILNDPAPSIITDILIQKKDDKYLKWLPIWIWGFVGVLGLLFFLFSPTLRADFLTNTGFWEQESAIPGKTYREVWEMAIQSWIFWCAVLAVSPYLLSFIKGKINASIEEAHRITNISREEHLKLKEIIFGKGSKIIIISISLVCMLYDFNAFGMGDILEEGWVYDTNGGFAAFSQFDNTNIPLFSSQAPDALVWYVNPFMCVMWLIIWLANWVYNVQFLWFSISFLLYANKIIKDYHYREDPQIVDRLRLTEPLKKQFIAVGYGFIPYLVVKFIYQIWFVPWLSDTIINTVMLVLFIIMVIVPPSIIGSDVREEKEAKFERAKDVGLFAITDVITRVQKNEEVYSDEVLTALLYHTYLQEQQVKEREEKKEKDKQKKSVAGPAASYGAKEGANMARTLPGNPLGL